MLILVGTVYLFFQRFLYMGSFNNISPFDPGPGVGLVEQLDDIVETGAQLFLVLRQAGAVFDYSGHRRAIKMAQFFLIAMVSDKAGHFRRILSLPIHIDIEINLDLEKLAEILIVIVEHPVEQGVADHDHLHL